MMSFNNNIVIKVSTGKNDSTQNLAVPGLYERGKYTTLNFPFPPNGIGIPTPQVLLASNPYTIKRASNGKLFAPANFGYVWTSIDTGRNWKQETCLPQNRNYSGFGTWAMDIAPNGKFLVLGTNGVVSDSIPGGAWNSTYVTVPASASYSKIEFADCNNVIAAGTAYITVSTDGGNTWVDKMRSDFLASMYNINGMAYPKPNKAYFAVSNGVVYGSTDKGTTLDPLLNDAVMMMQDVAAKGDSVWAVGYTGYTVPSAQGVSKIYRSFNGGATWSTYSGFSVGSTSVRLTDIEFPTSTVGYAAGSRDTIYKTTDAGVTWTRLPLPNGGVAPQLTYTDMFALDANTVFIVGNGYPKIAVYKTTDGGATWTDITADIRTLGGGGYLYSVMFHDANNGYVGTGSILFKTTDGGATWTLDIAPVGVSFQSLAFSPKNVPASTSMVNRKLYGVGLTGPGGNSTSIMEYGDPANVNVNTVIASTTPASCTAPTAGSVTVTASGGIAPYTYSADGVNFQSSNVLTGLTYGTKTITVKDAFCGTTTKTVTIGLTDNMTLTTTPDTTVCIGANFPLMATPNGTGATYLWSPASVLNSATVANPTGAINAATAFTVTASMNGCVRTKTINVGVRANPVVNAGPDKTVVDGYTVVLQGTGIFSPAYLAWTPNATLTQPNTYNPTAKPSTTTTYRLTIKDNYNCTSTDDVVVNVLPYCVHPVDAFTPNNDGQNDKWIITSNNASCIDRIYASVYNRYGNLVFKDDNYKNNWDGTYNGKPVPDGTYYYVITYKLVSGPEVVLKGDVTILR
jgi:gliding motility-associated-like protein